jgi:hypothetical protein
MVEAQAAAARMDGLAAQAAAAQMDGLAAQAAAAAVVAKETALPAGACSELADHAFE